MSNLVLPSPEIPLATCPHCGASVRIDKVWYQKLVELYRLINANLP